MEFNANAGIDLHIHSNASDGSLPPSDVLRRAQTLNLKAISITDHDTLEGSRAAASASRELPLKFITGVEISASPPPATSLTGSFHILGYGIDLDDPALNNALDKLQTARRDRNPQIIKQLNKSGCPISMAELQDAFGESQLGRPHIAQMMVKKGFVKSIDEAFDEYIGKGGPAYIDKYRLESSEAIQIIRNAGGIAVLAHPYLLKISDRKILENIIVGLKEMGLEGIEVYYPEHSPEDTVLYIELAKQYDLLMTGGTDYHGDVNPDIEMGIGRGGFHVPYKLYEILVGSFSAGREKERGGCRVEYSDHSELEQTIQYRFKVRELLDESLRHSSFVNEQNQPGMKDNERLEFLGDAVLNLIVGHMLMQSFPELQEGELSRIRAQLVNEKRLASMAKDLQIGHHLKLGKGELQTDGRNKPSLLADAFEAILAAVYLDGGFDAAFKLIENKFSSLIQSRGLDMTALDYKSRLQELVQTRQNRMPVYSVTGESGPDHEKTFRVQLTVDDVMTEGEGRSKKMAEQDAARKAIKLLDHSQR